MFVEVRGRAADGSPIRREWHLLAEGQDGPLIPSMAVEAIMRKSLAGHLPAPGARTAMTEVTLADYEALFAGRTIFTGTRQREPIEAQPLFRHVLGAAWDLLPSPIKRLHSTASVSMYSGRCTVMQGGNPIARAVTALVGFPKAGSDLPINVKLTLEDTSERWVRTVADRTFSSTLTLATGRSEGLVRERFGPLAADMALVLQGPSLNYVIRRWSLLGIPMPLWLGPKTTATESVDAEGRFHFDVKLWHPFIGSLVHYAGWLCPKS
jgi:hypothetical protein